MDLGNIKWNKNTYLEYVNYLISMSDIKYRDFNLRIISSKYPMLGIRLPILRKLAKEIFKGDYKSFLRVSGNTYYEEVMIKGLVLGHIKYLEELMEYFDDYILEIDNWAICDSFCNSLKIINKNKKYFLEVVERLIKSTHEYSIRVGLIILLNYYVEEDYLDYIFKVLDSIKSDLYYVNMGMAWLLCEVFTKYPDLTIKYLDNNKLNKFTINKTINKIRDSYRIDKKMKDYILKYRRN